MKPLQDVVRFMYEGNLHATSFRDLLELLIIADKACRSPLHLLPPLFPMTNVLLACSMTCRPSCSPLPRRSQASTSQSSSARRCVSAAAAAHHQDDKENEQGLLLTTWCNDSLQVLALLKSFQRNKSFSHLVTRCQEVLFERFGNLDKVTHSSADSLQPLRLSPCC